MSALDTRVSQAIALDSAFVKSLNLDLDITDWKKFDDFFIKILQEVKASWVAIINLSDRHEHALRLEALRSFNGASIPTPSLCHEFENLRIKFQAHFDTLMEIQTTIMHQARILKLNPGLLGNRACYGVQSTNFAGRHFHFTKNGKPRKIQMDYKEYWIVYTLDPDARQIRMHDGKGTSVYREDYWDKETHRWIIKRQD
ncbi:MAG: hypothetical protein Q9188_007249 [Gyalolechia gomerana]